MGEIRVKDSARRKWLGGYVREGKRGAVFIIERWIHGTHFHISTKCRTEKAAQAELVRFEMDPGGYQPQSSAEDGRRLCVITPELIAEYEQYQRNIKKTTTSHARDCARYLEHWALRFGGRDLRRLNLHRDIIAPLDEWQTAAINDTSNPRRKISTTGGRKSRVVALKGFTAWLRRVKGLLKRAEDPTLDLQVPRAEPEKLRRKKVVPFVRVQAIVPHIRADCLDTLLVISNTALHLTELRRFAQDGELFEPSPEKKAEGARAMLAVKHKGGRLHIVSLTTDEAFGAAKRIRMGGWAPSHSVMWFAMRAACAAAGVEAFNAGVLRHSVATWLHDGGTKLTDISEQLGHRDPRTTADFYREMGGQARVLALPRLKVVR